MSETFRLQILGAWIFPDGKIHWTNNNETHLKVMTELGMKSELLKIAQTIEWSVEELSHHYNTDLGYIAMRLGFIRVTSFMSSFIVEYLKDTFSDAQIASLYTIYKDLQSRQDFQISDFLTQKFMDRTPIIQCTSFSELIQHFRCSHF